MEEGVKHVFTLIEREGEKTRWVKVGVGFVNKDSSINVYLDALPVNGLINIREPFKKNNDHQKEDA